MKKEPIGRDENGEDMYDLSLKEKAGLYGGMSIGLLVLLIIALGIPQCCPAATPEQLDRLLPALAQVESGGRSWAIGDGGKAIGIYQIHRDYLIDANRFGGTHYILSDMLDPVKAGKVVRAYLTRYANGKGLEATARIHAGGPEGWKKESTVKYWNKVKKELEK